MTNAPDFFVHFLYPLITITVLIYLILLVVRVVIGKSAFSACIFKISNFLKTTLSKDTYLRISTTKLIIATAILSAFSVITAITVYEMFAHTSFIADAENVNGFMDIAFGLPVTVASSVLAILLAWNAITIANRQLDLEVATIRRELKPRMDEQVLETKAYVHKTLAEFAEISAKLKVDATRVVSPAQIQRAEVQQEAKLCVRSLKSALRQLSEQDQSKAKLFIEMCLTAPPKVSFLKRDYPSLYISNSYFSKRIEEFEGLLSQHRKLYQSNPDMMVNGLLSCLTEHRVKHMFDELSIISDRNTGLQPILWDKDIIRLDVIKLCMSPKSLVDIAIYDLLCRIEGMHSLFSLMPHKQYPLRAFFLEGDNYLERWSTADIQEKHRILEEYNFVDYKLKLIDTLIHSLVTDFNQKHAFFTADEVKEINNLAENDLKRGILAPLVARMDGEVYRIQSGYYESNENDFMYGS